jgi:hypothetical protein
MPGRARRPKTTVERDGEASKLKELTMHAHQKSRQARRDRHAHEGRDRRPQFDALPKAAIRRDFNMIAVWSSDRLGHSLKQLCRSRGSLHQQGGQEAQAPRATQCRSQEDRAGARRELAKGTGVLKIAKLIGFCTGTVQQLKREMAALT